MTCTADRHGTDDAYVNATCRCPAARQEHLVARKRRELRLITAGPVRIDATGSARRLQSLAAVGYGLHDLAARLSIDSGYLGHLRRPTHPRVLRSTARVVASLYDELADSTGPSEKARRHAQQQGWMPPSAWDTDDLDDPTAQPHPEWLMCSVPLCENPVKARGYCNAHYCRWRQHGDPLGGGPLRLRGIAKVWQRIDKTPGGCWIWTGTVGHEGYGQVCVSGRTQRAHRVVYELLHGPIIEGLTLDHLCHTRDRACPGGRCAHRLCVNPEHLEPVTSIENSTRGGNTRKATCPRGHLYDVLLRRGDGREERRCSQCKRDQATKHRSHLDPVAVARAMTGEPMPLTRAERLEAVARLEARGMPQLAIAQTLHLHPRQVLTDLTRIRLSPSASAVGPSIQKRTTA